MGAEKAMAGLVAGAVQKLGGVHQIGEQQRQCSRFRHNHTSRAPSEARQVSADRRLRFGASERRKRLLRNSGESSEGASSRQATRYLLTISRSMAPLARMV